MVDDIINVVKTWLNCFKPDNAKTKDKNPQFHKIVWATSFTNSINLTDKEKHLNPLSTVVYKRPATLQNLLTNYKKISLNLQPINLKCINASYSACGHCALCGNHGTHKNMVQNTNYIKTKNGNTIQLKQNLNCTNYGIYAACCNISSKIYIGQTINRFFLRWNTHRHNWNNNTLDSEKAALSIRYHLNHTDFPYNDKPISECYTVTFLQQPPKYYLDICRSSWIHQLDAFINIQATILSIQGWMFLLYLFFLQAFFLHNCYLKKYNVLALLTYTYTLHFTIKLFLSWTTLL